MANYLDSYLARQNTERPIDKKLSKIVSAFAKLRLYCDDSHVFDFYLQSPTVLLGKMTNSPKATNTATLQHISDCSSIGSPHAELHYNAALNHFEIVPLKEISINGSPYLCKEVLFDQDEIGFPCATHRHKIQFLLPLNDKTGEESGKANRLKKRVGNSNSEWNDTDKEAFLGEFLRFGLYRPFAVRSKAKLARKTVCEVHWISLCFTWELWCFLGKLYEKVPPTQKELKSFELLGRIVEGEEISNLGEKKSFEGMWSDYFDVERAQNCLDAILRCLLVTQLVNSEKESAENIRSLFQRTQLEITFRPDGKWDEKNDEEMIVSLYEKGIDSTGKIPQLSMKRFEAIFGLFCK